jgi:hypothetical protein
MFIVGDWEYKNSPFAKIPEHSKRSSWFLLTDGTFDDIIVDDHTTVKQIWKGRYKKLVEISKTALSYEHEFASSCKETSYTFNVKVKAKVLVDSPIDFYANNRNIDIRAFFNNQFALDVAKITRKYSIMEYSGIDDELTSALTSTHVLDPTTGLSYQIASVITEPNAEARQILKKKDDISIKERIDDLAGEVADKNLYKSYAKAVWEKVAQGEITSDEAIEQIEAYQDKRFDKQVNRVIKLRDEGMINDTDATLQGQNLLPNPDAGARQSLPAPKPALSLTDEYFNDEE